MSVLPDGVFSNDVKDEIPVTVIDNLVRLAGVENERVAFFHRRIASLIAHRAATADQVVKLPLRTVEWYGHIFLPVGMV